MGEKVNPGNTRSLAWLLRVGGRKGWLTAGPMERPPDATVLRACSHGSECANQPHHQLSGQVLPRHTNQQAHAKSPVCVRLNSSPPGTFSLALQPCTEVTSMAGKCQPPIPGSRLRCFQTFYGSLNFSHILAPLRFFSQTRRFEIAQAFVGGMGKGPGKGHVFFQEGEKMIKESGHQCVGMNL